jgi:hypothetical protein
MFGTNPVNEQHFRILIENLVREGKTEHEITAAVRRAQDDGGFEVRTRRLSYFR